MIMCDAYGEYPTPRLRYLTNRSTPGPRSTMLSALDAADTDSRGASSSSSPFSAPPSPPAPALLPSVLRWEGSLLRTRSQTGPVKQTTLPQQ